MKQKFAHYEKWEDYQNGMYTLNDVLDKDKKAIEAIHLLSDVTVFYETLQNLKNDWKVAWEINMSNQSHNRRAWLGAAACMYKCNCPEYLTRIVWNLLNKNTQQSANKIANKIIEEYERENNSIYKNMGNEMLF